MIVQANADGVEVVVVQLGTDKAARDRTKMRIGKIVLAEVQILIFALERPSRRNPMFDAAADDVARRGAVKSEIIKALGKRVLSKPP
jgi:hypothetical protein